MDVFSALQHLLNVGKPQPVPQSRPSNPNPAELPAANQPAYGSLVRPYGTHSPIRISNADKPYAISGYHGEPSALNIQNMPYSPNLNVYNNPATGIQTLEDDNSTSGGVHAFNPMPQIDHQTNINRMGVVTAAPTRLSSLAGLNPTYRR